MLSKCANPDCSATFGYFHLGRVFRANFPTAFDRRRATMGDGGSISKPRRLEFYWLCEQCSQKMTLVYDKDAGVKVRASASASAAA